MAMENVSKTEVFFSSGDLKCCADLYVPTNHQAKLPCIVMGHGFSGTKDFAIPAFANQFAANGFAVLAFDYRNFGKSEGELRQVIDTEQQRGDFRSAIQYVRSMNIIDADRIVLWGSSLSSGHVIAIAAQDSGIAAVIAMVPFLDAVRGQGAEQAPVTIQFKLLFAALKDVVHSWLRLHPHLIPVVGNPGDFATMTEPEAKPVTDELLAEGSQWRNEFAPRIAFGMPRYKDGTVELLKMPILFCVAEKDLQASPEFTLQVARRALKGEIQMYPEGHFGLYVGKPREKAILDQLEFLKRHLVE
jgi:fermentation-respiration switch protein FrsA (DUF1100 family)